MHANRIPSPGHPENLGKYKLAVNALLIIRLFTVEKLLANGLSGFVTSRRLCTKVSIVTKQLFENFFPVVSVHMLALSTVSETVCHKQGRK